MIPEEAYLKSVNQTVETKEHKFKVKIIHQIVTSYYKASIILLHNNVQYKFINNAGNEYQDADADTGQ